MATEELYFLNDRREKPIYYQRLIYTVLYSNSLRSNNLIQFIRLLTEAPSFPKGRLYDIAISTYDINCHCEAPLTGAPDTPRVVGRGGVAERKKAPFPKGAVADNLLAVTEG